MALAGALDSAFCGVGMPLPGSCQSLEWRIVQHELPFQQCHPYRRRSERFLDYESGKVVQDPAENPAQLWIQIAGLEGSVTIEAVEDRR